MAEALKMRHEFQDVHALTKDALFRELGSSEEGLDKDEAKRRQAEFGPNTIKSKRQVPIPLRFLKHLSNFFAILLWIAAGLALLVEYLLPGGGMYTLSLALVGVVFVNAVFSFYQEYRAEKAAEALRGMMAYASVVIRSGKEEEIPAEQIVPGDIIALKEGDRVAADARVIEQFGLKVNNAPLTGESLPLERTSEPESGGILESRNVAFSGTTVVSGTGKGIVFATGMGTEFGKIAHLTQEMGVEITPLQREIVFFIRVITAIAVAFGVVFFFSGMLIGRSFWENFIFAIGIIVAAVPEGLLPTVTLTLSLASRRMARRNALIKGLNSVETLGCTTVICTDKTGTITENKMNVTDIYVYGAEIKVQGVGYSPRGKLIDVRGNVLEDKTQLKEILRAAVLCNDAELVQKDGTWNVIGDPTEGALVVMARRAWPTEEERRIHKRIYQIPFDPDRKRMSTICRMKEGGVKVYVKGALQTILPLCRNISKHGQVKEISEEERVNFLAVGEKYARLALRVICLAYREVDERDKYEAQEVEQDLTLLGLVGIIDPPRPEVPDAVAKCKRAGIKIIMITGDDKITAEAIARNVRIIETSDPQIVEGSELDKMNRGQILEILKSREILFARALPKHKLDVVMALKELGETVAVTGDGVNDGPALKEADIGIAMGKMGTDVAKETADMILVDDNFASIVNAVEEGRAVFDNIRRFASYVLTSNIPEIVPYISYILLGIPLPLSVIQILTVDLGTDIGPAVALGTEKPEADAMIRPPRKRDERILNRSILLRSYGLIGHMQALAGMAGYYWILKRGGWEWGMQLALTDPLYMKATTMCLAAIIVMQIANVLACRTTVESVFKAGLFTNINVLYGIASEIILITIIVYTPWAQKIFGTASLSAEEWLFFVPFAICLFATEEMRKIILRRKRHFTSLIGS